MSFTTPNWTDERVMQLKKLWADGHSASKISDTLHTSRNAVIGKVHRLGLKPRAVTMRHVGPKRVRVKIETKPEAPSPRLPQRVSKLPPPDGNPLPDPKTIDIARVSLADLEPHHCKWPCAEHVNNDTPLYCGCQKMEGLSYCADHARRAYAPPKVTGQFRLSHRDLAAVRNPRIIKHTEPV